MFRKKRKLTSFEEAAVTAAFKETFYLYEDFANQICKIADKYKLNYIAWLKTAASGFVRFCDNIYSVRVKDE